MDISMYHKPHELIPSESTEGTRKNPLTRERVVRATAWIEQRISEINETLLSSDSMMTVGAAMSDGVGLHDIQEYRNQVLKAFSRNQPPDDLALLAGVYDKSFRNVHGGWHFEYRGTGFVRMDNGELWECNGHGGHGGNPWVRVHEGAITMGLVDEKETAK